MSSKSNEKCAKKTNLLVYKGGTDQRADRRGPYADIGRPNFKIPICSAKPKHIRVCTGAEMKKMCPPKLCDCHKVKPRGRGLMGLLGFGLKAAIAAAVWYVTYDMGIWGSNEDTHDLYRSYCKLMKSPCEQNKEKWEPLQCKAEKQLLKIPRFDPYGYCDNPPVNHERMAYDFQNRWNHAVELIFSGIAGFPFNVINAVAGREKSAAVEVEEEQCILYSNLPEDEREEIRKNAYKK